MNALMHPFVEIMVLVLILLDLINVIVQLVINFIIKHVLVSCYFFVVINKYIKSILSFSIKDINECTEPNVDGSYTNRCNPGQDCINTIGSFTCACNAAFNTTGTCNCT